MFGRGSLQFQMPSAKVAISAAASAAATAMIVRSVIRDYIPPELKHYLYSKLKKLFGSISNQFTIVIEDFQGFNPNELFTATELYLQSTVSSTRRFRVTLPKKETKISFVMERNSELIDSFNGVKLRWRLVTKSIKPTHIGGRDPYSPPTYVSELRRHELSFHKKHRELVLKTYLPFVMERAREMREEKKTLKLYTLRSDGRRITRGGNPWQSVNFDHPATFKTLAIDAGAKEAIVRDLERFVGRKELYRTVGKAWKRGYLLYGPPGTGKSSLIAAMANYLNFDIYDLELSSVRSNSLLRKILISTANRSILVVEDIDCSVEVPPDRQQSGRKVYSNGRLVIEERQVTLSGLLNFVDGLWSSCGDERIIVFTTNHKDKLDPALLRPGRMDVHIHMSYCTADGFRILCSNFLGISHHPLLEEVEAMMQKTRVTPAEVGEQLMKHDDPDISLRGLKEFMEKKQITEQSEAGEAEAAA